MEANYFEMSGWSIERSKHEVKKNNNKERKQ